MRKCPAFRAAFVEACRVRDVGFELARYELIDGAEAGGLIAAGRAILALEGRRGRLRPKLYRRLPPGTGLSGRD